MPAPARGPVDRLRAIRRVVRRAVLRRRRGLAALCVAAATALGVQAATAPPPPTTTVLTAARDLAAGVPLAADDVAAVEFAAGSEPEGAVGDPVGHTLAAPLRRGEPVTDVRLVGERLAVAHPDLATLPLRFPDAGLAALLEPGDRIDLVATDPQAGEARVVAADVLVLAVPDPPAATGMTDATSGTVVVVGVPPLSLTAVSEASVRSFLGFSWSR